MTICYRYSGTLVLATLTPGGMPNLIHIFLVYMCVHRVGGGGRRDSANITGWHSLSDH